MKTIFALLLMFFWFFMLALFQQFNQNILNLYKAKIIWSNTTNIWINLIDLFTWNSWVTWCVRQIEEYDWSKVISYNETWYCYMSWSVTEIWMKYCSSEKYDKNKIY